MSLNDLAIKHGSDKSSKHHGYCDIYERYLLMLIHEPVMLLEIGVGGYNYPEKGGAGLRMWRDYFTVAKIIGVDIYPKSFSIEGVEIYELKNEPFTEYDIVIDDASHINEQTIDIFQIRFPLLKSGGLYFVEDAHTSYWFDNYGGNPDPEQGKTTMNYFKKLTDQLNVETLLPKYHREFSGEIEYIHFYKQLIVIKKK